MAEKIRMLAAQIEDLIVKDVRRHAHCTTFKSFPVHKIAEGQIPDVNWNGGHRIDFGGADEKACSAALREVIPRMQRLYHLI